VRAPESAGDLSSDPFKSGEFALASVKPDQRLATGEPLPATLRGGDPATVVLHRLGPGIMLGRTVPDDRPVFVAVDEWDSLGRRLPWNRCSGIDCAVMAVNPATRSHTLSVGSQDGVEVGTVVLVYRDARFVTMLLVENVFDNDSRAREIPGMTRLALRPGDPGTSRFGVPGPFVFPRATQPDRR
jgi:hypothetical protein